MHLLLRPGGGQSTGKVNISTIIVLLLAIGFVVFYFISIRPQNKRSRMAGHESSAIASLKAILIAEQQYRLTTEGSYTNLSGLKGALPNYIDSQLATGEKSGYCFIVTTQGGSAFTALALPLERGVSGQRTFFMDMSGVVRFEKESMASSNSPPVQ